MPENNTQIKPVGKLTPINKSVSDIKPVGNLTPVGTTKIPYNNDFTSNIINNEAVTDEIIDKLDTKNDDEKKLIKNIAIAQKQGRATMEDLSNAILTVQGQHPNQDGGSKYYMKEVNGTFLPVPIKNGERPPKGYDVASVWGDQESANDDSFIMSAGKHLFNGFLKGVLGVETAIDLPYALATGENSDWYKRAKNRVESTLFKTPEYEQEQIFDTSDLKEASDFFDPSRYNFNKNNVQGAVLNGLESITSFLTGAAATGGIGKLAGAAAEGSGLISGGGKLAQGLAGATNTGKIAKNFAGAYMVNYDEALRAAEDSGLEGQDKYAFASIATIPTALLEIVAGTEGLFVKNQLAREGKRAMYKELAQGIEKETGGKLTKESLEKLYGITTKEATKLNRTFVGQVAQNVGEEAGTEAVQAFALNAAKNIYDNVKGEEKFKTDPFSLESFGEYVNNALAGGLGAGGPALVGVSQKRRIDKAEKQSNDAYATIQKGLEAVSAFKADIDNSVANEELTPEQGEQAKFKVDAYSEYYQQTKGLDLNDEDRKKAFELSFNIQGIKTEIPTSEADIAKLSPIELAKVQGKKEIVKGLQKELDALILKQSVQKETTVGPDTVNKVVKNEEKKVEQTPLSDLEARYGKAEVEPTETEKVVPERSEKRNAVPKFEAKDESGNYEFNKLKPLEKKQALHDYFDENPGLNNEVEGFIEGGQNNVWKVDIGGSKRYIQFAKSIIPDKYTGDIKNFPGGKQTVFDSDGREYTKFTEPVGIRLESIKTDSGGRKRVLNIYNKATGKHIVFGKELEKGTSKYSDAEIKQLQDIQKNVIKPPKSEVKTTPEPVLVERPGEIDGNLQKERQEVFKNGHTRIKISEVEKDRLHDEGYSEKNIDDAESDTNASLKQEDVDFINTLEKHGMFNSVGNLNDWRPNMGMSTAEVKSALKNIKAGKITVTTKKLIQFIDRIKDTGYVPMIGQSGGMSQKFDMPLYQFLLGDKTERELTIDEIEEELQKEAAREEVFAKTGHFSKAIKNEKGEDISSKELVKFLKGFDGLSNMSVLEYAKFLSSEPEVEEVLDLMIKNVSRIEDNTFFKGVIKGTEDYWGVYEHNSGNIYLYESIENGSIDEIVRAIAHEYLHAFTVSALEKDISEMSGSERKFAGVIEDIYNELKSNTDYGDEYGFKNTREFVTEIMTRPDFVAKLKRENLTIWDKIINAILDFFGIKSKYKNDPKKEELVKKAIETITEFIPASKPKIVKNGIAYNTESKSKKKPFKKLEEMSAKDLSKKLTMSLEAYREKVLGRSLEQIRKDLQFIDTALESEEYDAEQKKSLKAIRENIKKEEKRDAAKWFAYKEDVEMLSSIMSEGRLEDMSNEKLLEAYNLMVSGDFQDEAKNTKVNQLKNQIAYRMFIERKQELKEYDKFVEEQANKKDLAAKDVLMKTLSHMTENQPELQKFSKMFDNAHFDMQGDRYDLKTQLEKLGQDVIREKNKSLGITGKLLDKFSSDSTKYFQFVEHPDGRYYTLEEAKEKNFTPAQIKFLKFMLYLSELRNEQLDEKSINEVNNDVLKVDKGVKEAFKTEGILQAFSSYIGNGFNVRNVRINYKGVPMSYGEIEQKLIKESKTLKDKTKALAEMAWYQLQARRQLKKGVNVDEVQNPLITKDTGEYNLSTDGRLKSKFNKPRDKDRGYSKDFYKAAHTFIDDYTHVKYMAPLLPYIQSIEHINKMGFKEHGVKNNVAEWVKQWIDLHIFKKEKQGALGPELDVFFKTLRRLTSLIVMSFNAPAAAWNVTMGTYNNIRQETLKEQVKGTSRLLKDGVLNKKAVDILKKYQVVSFDYDSNPKLYAGKLFDMLAHGLTRAGEYYVQGSIFLGYLTDKEYDSFEYKDVNGVKELVVKDGVDEKALKDKFISYKNRVSDIQGKYHEKDRRNYMAGEFGKLVGQFRTWLPDAVKQRFGEEYIDRDGVVHKGSYRTFIGQGFADLKVDIKENGIKGLTENKEAMANLKGLMVVAAFMALRFGGGDDKKRKKGDVIDQALGNLLYIFDIDQLKFMVKNPIAAQGTLTKFVAVMEDAMKLDVEKGAKDIKNALPYNKVVDLVDEVVED